MSLIVAENVYKFCPADEVSISARPQGDELRLRPADGNNPLDRLIEPAAMIGEQTEFAKLRFHEVHPVASETRKN